MTLTLMMLLIHSNVLFLCLCVRSVQPSSSLSASSLRRAYPWLAEDIVLSLQNVLDETGGTSVPVYAEGSVRYVAQLKALQDEIAAHKAALPTRSKPSSLQMPNSPMHTDDQHARQHSRTAFPPHVPV